MSMTFIYMFMESSLYQSYSCSLSALKTLPGTILFLTPKYDSCTFQTWGKNENGAHTAFRMKQNVTTKRTSQRNTECSFIGKSIVSRVWRKADYQLSAVLGRNLGYMWNETWVLERGIRHKGDYSGLKWQVLSHTWALFRERKGVR